MFLTAYVYYEYIRSFDILEIYIVRTGDTIRKISEEFGVPASRIAYDNEIVNDELSVGQSLIILKPDIIYEVRDGDTLYGIADAYGITVNQLLRNNSFLLNENFLIPGTNLVITYDSIDRRAVNVFGYAYSFINDDILEEACLFFDELLPFPYGFNEDGSLLPMNDDSLLETAKRFGNKTRMVITPLDRNERFNNQLVVALLSDESMQNSLIDNINDTMIYKSYNALDIDFEFIPGQFREQYVMFVEKVRTRLNENGFKVSVALPPKISDDQQGLLYEGIDYAGLGMAADSVFLMTYEWGYKYGPPMAIAPIPSVRRVLDYAVSVILADKIYMGIPNYAYDWPLPYVRGTTVAETIGNTEAVKRAYEFGADILYDEQAKAPYYYYTDDNNTEHVVWFEDVRSIIAKYDLVEEYGFSGAGYWNLMRRFRQNWMYVNLIK